MFSLSIKLQKSLKSLFFFAGKIRFWFCANLESGASHIG